MLFCLWVNWYALRTWFTSDDFAWLGLRLHVHSFQDLLWALFAPLAQGTVRTLSERLYFMVFSSLFGLNAIPFRIWAFLTQFANIALLSLIARRLTRSPLAAFLAPILWCANAAMAQAMSWSSAYNELLCAFFLLSAFFFLLRHIESGRLADRLALWTCFLLGFGALEHIVVFPALAALYSLFVARSYFRQTLPLFIPSLAFTIAHFTLVPSSSDPLYRLYFDSSVLSTFRVYWLMALAAFRPDALDWHPLPLGLALSLSLTIPLVVFAAWKLYRRDPRGLFFLLWFVFLIAPVLPLKNHIQDYYLTLPLTGLALLAAWAIASAFSTRRFLPAALATLLATSYLFFSVTDLRVELRWYYARAKNMKTLLLGLDAVHKAHPDSMILLDNVSDNLFWAGFGAHPFQLLGIGPIYLAPGSERDIAPHPEWGGIADFIAPASEALNALRQNRAIVISVSSSGLLDVTAAYKKILAAQFLTLNRWNVNAGDPLFASRMGPEWYPIENAYRWMPRSATFEIGGPAGPGESLVLSGFLPPAVAANGPIHLTVTANGFPAGTVTIDPPSRGFVAVVPLPPQVTGVYAIKIALSLDRVTRVSGDTRDLGLIFGRFDVKTAR